MITSEKIFAWIDKLKAVAGRDRKCNMDYVTVDHEPSCNTPGCHGGWAALALGSKSTYFSDGCKSLAKFLGFEYTQDLEDWARDNPEIWGNKYGFFMFACPHAFNQTSPEFPVQVLIEHWTKVGKRLARLEEANK